MEKGFDMDEHKLTVITTTVCSCGWHYTVSETDVSLNSYDEWYKHLNKEGANNSG